MQFDKVFYQKHGIKITDEPINRNKTAEQTRVEVLLHDTVMNKTVNAQVVKSVEQAVEKYPDSEALKNYLYAAYLKNGQKTAALACLHDTVKQHPNYVFGLINLVNHHIQEKEIDEATALLTKPYDVCRVEDEDFIHESVFISYYQAVVRLALAKYDMKTAEKYHKMMFDYDPNAKMVKQLAGEILKGRLMSMTYRMIAPSVRNVKTTKKAILGWETKRKRPVFIHPEVEQLYVLNAKEMPEEAIHQLLTLPRETFIQDLENVLADVIRRRHFHLNHETWDFTTMSFPLHASYFLAELEAYDSLPKILNILRQDKELLDYWFSDSLGPLFFPTLYRLGQNQLPLLKAFVLENNNYSYARSIATEVAAQTALRQPERRDEIIQWFKDIIQAHLDQPDNDGLIDNRFFGSMLADILDCQAVELEKEITGLFEKGWVEPGICGNLEEVLDDLHKPKEDKLMRVSDLPASIFERYSGKYSDKVEKSGLVSRFSKEPEDPYQSFLMQSLFGGLLDKGKEKALKQADSENEQEDSEYQQPQEPIRRIEPKLGRNDPCHCGSGKKYKKCHGA